jgi:hypothetical protein
MQYPSRLGRIPYLEQDKKSRIISNPALVDDLEVGGSPGLRD